MGVFPDFERHRHLARCGQPAAAGGVDLRLTGRHGLVDDELEGRLGLGRVQG